MQNNDINPLYKKGFEHFREGLEEFLTENEVTYDEHFGYFKVYSSVSVESTDIIRTSGSYYGEEWFSDVAVVSEEAIWYGRALLLLEFYTEKNKDPINLVLLRWFDEEEEEMYGCPRLYLSDQYTCIYLDSIDMSVHIIPRFNYENQFLVNKYIF